MSSFEMNKIAGAFLGALVLALGLSAISDELFSHPRLSGGHETLQGHDSGVAVADAAGMVKPLADRLVTADPAKGAQGSKACQSCHSFVKDGGVKAGPPLYGIVERPIASYPGFSYSKALEAKTGNWTFEALDRFLADPKSYANGTKMTYAGERDASRRADIIGYLDSLSDDPRTLPGKNAMTDAK
jgi:cytochrome c